MVVSHRQECKVIARKVLRHIVADWIKQVPGLRFRNRRHQFDDVLERRHLSLLRRSETVDIFLPVYGDLGLELTADRFQLNVTDSKRHRFQDFPDRFGGYLTLNLIDTRLLGARPLIEFIVIAKNDFNLSVGELQERFELRERLIVLSCQC